MRIAQIAPLWELVPPAAYGGTELVVYNLCEELSRLGHEVTLFAARGSQSPARLLECAPSSLRTIEEQIANDKTHCVAMSYELAMLQQVFSSAEQFDVIHNHLGYQALAFSPFLKTPMVTTLHNVLSPEPVRDLYLRNAHLPFISISNYQQTLWPELNYSATIYHGIDMSSFQPSYDTEGKNYLVFLGRLSPEKGPNHAIDIALSLGMKLVMAGKIDRVDQAYYEKEIAHRIDGEQISYIGEVNHAQKVELLRNAAALVHPVIWPEPFGLVMIEAMACGTPVFALRQGSIPEVINPGVTGSFAETPEALTEALRDWKRYDRRRIRQVAEERFSRERMVKDHVRVYEHLVAAKASQLSTTVLTPTALAEIRKMALSALDPIAPSDPEARLPKHTGR